MTEQILTPFLDASGVTLYAGDCIEVMRQLPEASVDAIVTDPPYGLEFMGKDWDRFSPVDLDRGGRWTKDKRSGPGNITKEATPGKAHGRVSFGANRSYTSECKGCGKRDAFRNPHECDAPKWQRVPVDDGAPPQMLAFQTWTCAWASEAFRILKPGGHLLAFAGTRTYHRMASGVEDAGFEIRDCIAWMYGSGFPKSKNLDGEWSGWGTALKPAFEPVVVARKPLVGTVAQNVLEHGTGAINVDGCRIAGDTSGGVWHGATRKVGYDGGWDSTAKPNTEPHTAGRWPANVVLDEAAGEMLDEQSGNRPGMASQRHLSPAKPGMFGVGHGAETKPFHESYDDNGGASRFFYCAKASKKDRNTNGAENTHPTVKPTELMRWLIRLVTPPGGIILDPFGGSGSTGVAARMENTRCILIEREAEYLDIIRQRLDEGPLLSMID